MGERAEVYARDFERGVRLSYEHAVHLLDSAGMMLAKGRNNSAKFLALHAREELGRALFLMDDIKRGRPWVSEKRWESKLTKHGPKLRRFHMAVNEAVGYREGPVTITWGEPTAPTKYVLEGEVIKRFAEDDMRDRDRTLYVDYGEFHGSLQWISPIEPMPTDASLYVGYSWYGCEVVKTESSKQGIDL